MNVYDCMDVELIATILEFARTSCGDYELLDMISFRAVSKRWKAAAATAVQRWIEQQIMEAARRSSSVYRQRFTYSIFWTCSEKAIHCLKACADDLGESFFQSVKTIWLRSGTDASVSWVPRTFSNLTGLVMEAKKINEPSLELLSSLGIKLPQLSAVGFGYQCLLNEDEVMAVLSSVSNLKFLSLTTAYGCSLRSRNYKLEFLDLSNFQLHYQSHLVAFLETQDQLRSINLSNIRHVGDRTLCTIGAVCKKLEELELLWAIHCTESALVAVLEGCPCITKLHCPGWGNEPLTALPEKCPSITALNVDLKEVSLAALTGLSFCKELRDLFPVLVDLCI